MRKTAVANRVWRLHEHDADQDMIRLNPNLMREDGFQRNQLIKLVNKANGKKTFAYAKGAGEEYKLYATTIAISYDARLRLGVDTKEPHEIELSAANFLEQEIFYLFYQSNIAARREHAFSVQGWALGFLGFITGVIGLF